MPIEIQELTVRARVRDEENRNQPNPTEEGTASEAGSGHASEGNAELRRVAEIAQEIIKRQKER